jgi:chromate transporter
MDKTTAIMAVIAFLLLWKIKKLPEPVIIIAAALIGLLVYPLSQH